MHTIQYTTNLPCELRSEYKNITEMLKGKALLSDIFIDRIPSSSFTAYEGRSKQKVSKRKHIYGSITNTICHIVFNIMIEY